MIFHEGKNHLHYSMREDLATDKSVDKNYGELHTS